MCILCLISFVILAIVITWISFVIPPSMYDGITMEKNLRYALTMYLRIPLVLMLFAVLKYLGSTPFYRQSMLSKKVSRFAVFTFGVFLVHILVRQALGTGGLNILNSADYPWFSLLASPIIVFFLSVAMVWCLRKIPLSRWILP